MNYMKNTINEDRIMQKKSTSPAMQMPKHYQRSHYPETRFLGLRSITTSIPSHSIQLSTETFKMWLIVHSHNVNFYYCPNQTTHSAQQQRQQIKIALVSDLQLHILTIKTNKKKKKANNNYKISNNEIQR